MPILRNCVLGACSVALSFLALGCSEGDFDQRLRADIDELRFDASEGPFNSNPTKGPAKVTLMGSTGGPVSIALAQALAVAPDGSTMFSEADLLGSGGTSSQGNLTITLRRPYVGAVVVRLQGGVTNGMASRYSDPARSDSAPLRDFAVGDELLGFVVDSPEIQGGVVASPLTTLAVEYADFLGARSSGHLGYAARQVGRFFEVRDVRSEVPDNMAASVFRIDALEQDLAMLTFAVYAKILGTSPMAVVSAMRLDIRDDGELNGSGPLVPGSGAPLASFGSAGFMGTTLLRSNHFFPGNEDNSLGFHTNSIAVGSSVDNALNALDQAHSLTVNLLTLDEFVQQYTALQLTPGEAKWPGIRGFERQGNTLTLVHGTEGPWLADVVITSNNPGVVDADAFGRFVANPASQVGDQATMSVRITTDGDYFVAGVDRTFTIDVTIK